MKSFAEEVNSGSVAFMDLDEIDAVFVALKENDCAAASDKSNGRVASICSEPASDACFAQPEAGSISAEGFDELRARQNPAASFEALKERLNPAIGIEALRSLMSTDDTCKAPNQGSVFGGACSSSGAGTVSAGGFDAPCPEPVFAGGFEEPCPEPVFAGGFEEPCPEPVFAGGFDAPCPEPVFAGDFDEPRPEPEVKDSINSPLPWPVFADGFDAPSTPSVFGEGFDPFEAAADSIAAFDSPWMGSSQENVFGTAEPEEALGGGLSNSCGFAELSSIDANFNRYLVEQQRIAADRRKVKTISYISTVIVFFLGVFTFALYRYVADLRENVRISNLARDYMTEAAAPPETDAFPLDNDNVLNELPVPAAQEVRDEPVIDDSAPRPILSKILNLREAFDNDDIVGYVKIEGTEIDYMVMQSDDNDFYLDRDVYGQVTAAGSVFMDYESDAASLGRNTILYAHNMRNGTMFHNLRYYQDRRFFDANRYVHLTTLHDQTVWEIFAFYTTTIDFEYIQVYFPDDNSFLELIDEITARSVHNSGIEVGRDDLMLTMSTCSGATRDSRFVVHARLVSIVAVEDLEMTVM